MHKPEYSRNYGFWNEAEQTALEQSRVAIAGVGGDGFQLGIKLAMAGVQRFDIADPEVFEPENSNRVPGARISTYGRNKAEVFKEYVLDINKDAEVNVYTDGVTESNVEHFVAGASLVLDESELTYLHVGTMLARESRARGIPSMLVMNVGFSAQVTSFKPDSKDTFEKFMGIPEGASLDEVKDMTVDFSRCLPYIPSYTDLRALEAVQQGAPLPSISQGVDIASAIGSAQAFLHLTRSVSNRRPEPVWAPEIQWIDALTFASDSTRRPRRSHYKHLAIAALRDKVLRINPSASYSQADRDRRSADSE